MQPSFHGLQQIMQQMDPSQPYKSQDSLRFRQRWHLKTRAAACYAFKWSQEHTAQLIKLRGDKDGLFTGAKNSASVSWRNILEEMGLEGKVSALQAKKKWDNLKKKYKDCKCPASGEGVDGKSTAATWPWFVLMDEVLGQRHSTNPPVLMASIPEDKPGQDEEEDEPSQPRFIAVSSEMASQDAQDEVPSAACYAFKWSQKHTAQLIKLRGERDGLFTGAKHSASVSWRNILEEMGLEGMVTALQAKKKWDNLKKKYKDCKCPASGEGVDGKSTAATWPWFVLMDEVLGQRHSTNPPVLIASIPEDKPGQDEEEDEPSQPRFIAVSSEKASQDAQDEVPSAACYTFKWSQEHTAQLIKLRGDKDGLFTGAKNSASVSWRNILEEMGLEGMVTALQAKKKWDNLKKKYKDCKCPASGEGVDGKSTAATWPWFVLMDEVLGQRHSTNPPVLMASIPEDKPGQDEGPSQPGPSQPGPSQPGPSQPGPSQPGPSQPGPSRLRKRDRVEELLDLMKEDMMLQREAEERRAQESNARMERLFSILEKMVDK